MRTATEIRMSVQRLACTECGAEAHASCDCGKPYVPAKERAAEAIRANPQKSNRAIAEEIGADEKVVRIARGETADNSAVERVGLDGKVRRMPVRHEPEQAPADEAAESFKTLVDLALRVKDLDLTLIQGLPGAKAAARRVVEAWSQAQEGL